MVSITLSVPEEVRETMKKFPEINWSGLVRTCIIEKAKTLNMKENLLKDLSKEKEFNEWAVNIVRKGRHKNEMRS
ncbi:MAG: hypothetical protein AABW47_03775 [Nanoarchaeota archaeon]